MPSVASIFVLELVTEMLVEPPMLLPHFKSILETQDQSPVGPYLDPLVALHLLGKSFP